MLKRFIDTKRCTPNSNVIQYVSHHSVDNIDYIKIQIKRLFIRGNKENNMKSLTVCGTRGIEDVVRRVYG